MKYIFQTWKSHDLTSANPIFELSRASWQKMHPEWEYDFFDDAEIDLFVKAHFPKFYRYYFSRYIGQIKRVDLFRYCNLFIKGGIYSDLDGECIRSLEPFLNERSHHIIGSLKNKASANRYPNALMISLKPRCNFWLFVLAHACQRYENNKGFYSTEYLTGPVLLTDAIVDYDQKAIAEINEFIRHYFPDFIDLKPDYGVIKKEPLKIVDYDVFYPIDWHRFSKDERLEIIRQRIHSNELPSDLLSPQSFTLNYWTHSWTIPGYSVPNRIWLRLRYYAYKVVRWIKSPIYTNG